MAQAARSLGPGLRRTHTSTRVIHFAPAEHFLAARPMRVQLHSEPAPSPHTFCPSARTWLRNWKWSRRPFVETDCCGDPDNKAHCGGYRTKARILAYMNALAAGDTESQVAV